VLLGLVVASMLAASANAQPWRPAASWLVQAQCIHRHEGSWTANTGNGYFGGMQFAKTTWLHLNGPALPAFAHPGNPAYPFAVPPREQLYMAWLLWRQSGRTWAAWGAVGAACSSTSTP
jgi:hypothetical protein